MKKLFFLFFIGINFIHAQDNYLLEIENEGIFLTKNIKLSKNDILVSVYTLSK